MRTKTLILSGVVAALASASLMAQVYSLNSVGYINVTIPGPGQFSLISDQLFANGQGVAQTVSPLLDSQVLDGTHAGLTFYKFTAGTGAGSGYFVFGVEPSTPPNWSIDPATSVNAATEVTLNPGEGIFVYNPNATTTLSFVGTVPQGSSLNVTNYSAFNIVSSIVPQAAAIDSVEGLTATVGDTLYFYDSTSYGIVGLTAGGWETVLPNTQTPPNGTAPSPPVGSSFFYYANLPAGTSEVWTRSFTVN